MKSLTTATVLFSKALWKVAKHPAFVIAAAGVAVWEANLFNLRGEIEKFSGQSLGLYDNISNMVDGGFNPFNDSMKELEQKIEENNSEIDRWGESLISVNPPLQDLRKNTDNVSESVKRLNESLKGLNL